MGSIEAAIAAIKLLEPGEQFSYRKVAAEYHCYCTTLAWRHQGIAGSRSTMAENQQALHPQQEQELLRYIERLTRQGLPPSQPIIRRFALEITKKSLEKARLINISSATTSISSHAGPLASIARATRLTLYQSIASTLSFCAASSANTILSLMI
ncbi:uncharacterized protein M421DRAFT_413138 [Didymella exigua CBS 183.55]|uniref:HTH CENPB-type domain-containing protein n=1 Tax=Didymella exigua CBS 183.55 TaxID=1150837 RepID=A0A6A5R6F3_9PLEO|nr:uncharacterized protein M421DRAFT_413138 [Didymella exigua CBS 183.55]KAF1922316.1 hypothetical protein M421DRAFT_413138 [Didymella exigua CBS 183.55]